MGFGLSNMSDDEEAQCVSDAWEERSKCRVCAKRGNCAKTPAVCSGFKELIHVLTCPRCGSDNVEEVGPGVVACNCCWYAGSGPAPELCDCGLCGGGVKFCEGDAEKPGARDDLLENIAKREFAAELFPLVRNVEKTLKRHDDSREADLKKWVKVLYVHLEKVRPTRDEVSKPAPDFESPRREDCAACWKLAGLPVPETTVEKLEREYAARDDTARELRAEMDAELKLYKEHKSAYKKLVHETVQADFAAERVKDALKVVNDLGAR